MAPLNATTPLVPVVAPRALPPIQPQVKKSNSCWSSCGKLACVCCTLGCCVVPIALVTLCVVFLNFSYYAHHTPSSEFFGDTEMLIDLDHLSGVSIVLDEGTSLKIAATSLAFGAKLECEETESMTFGNAEVTGKGYKCAYDDDDFAVVYAPIGITVPSGLNTNLNIKCTDCTVFTLMDNADEAGTKTDSALNVVVTGGGQVVAQHMEETVVALTLGKAAACFSNVNVDITDSNIALGMEESCPLSLSQTSTDSATYTASLVLNSNGSDVIDVDCVGDIEAIVELSWGACGSCRCEAEDGVLSLEEGTETGFDVSEDVLSEATLFSEIDASICEPDSVMV
ncbi:hypothetical protein KIPB_005979 [Kipferlia bialata]|uniref:Uncharacterized protein n=1 Tax=Kipferlia bialata TaxID=797122 RepID=A0A9K3CWW9_9EUKA|nr:hypothetical protein KIPB_005979 [Kipferlia bialata]|eukprot:g5979.t1